MERGRRYVRSAKKIIANSFLGVDKSCRVLLVQHNKVQSKAMVSHRVVDGQHE